MAPIVLLPEQQPNTIICLALHSRGMAHSLKEFCEVHAGFAQKEALAERELISQGNVHPCGRWIGSSWYATRPMQASCND